MVSDGKAIERISLELDGRQEAYKESEKSIASLLICQVK